MFRIYLRDMAQGGVSLWKYGEPTEQGKPEEGYTMDKRNGRERNAGGVELIRIRPHDMELDMQRRCVEKNRAGRNHTENRADRYTTGAREEGNRAGRNDAENRVRRDHTENRGERYTTGARGEGNRAGRNDAENRAGRDRAGNRGERYTTGVRGQGNRGGRNHTGYNRMEKARPGNRRTGKRRWIRKRMTMAATVVCTILLGLGGIHLVKAGEFPDTLGTEETEEIGGENCPQEILGPVPMVPNEVLEREGAEHEKTFIVIDPGHGGTDTGCSRGEVMESEVNMQIANRLAGKLQGMGFETLLLREDDMTELSLEQRVERAELENADIFVSIHQNAYDEDVDDIKGIETWYYGGSEGSRRLAELVHLGAVGETGAMDRGIQDTKDLYVLKNTSMPACLIETAFLSSRSDRGRIVTGEYQDQVAEGIAQGIYTYFNPKTMYLTFDDGPSAENTTAVLDILKERNIKATFFVVGENVRRHPDVAKRIVEEGHAIGIHCNNHDYRKLYQSADSYLEDFQKAYDTVYEVTGVETKLFRFPGGSVNAYNKAVGAEIIRRMTEKGYVYFDWNASLEDAVNKSTPEALIQNAVSSTLGRKKVVMLAHDVIYNTTQCLEELLDSFPEYEMKPLSAEVEPIQF